METEIVEKEGGLPVFDTNIPNTFFFQTAEITIWLTGKIGTNLPAEEGLRLVFVILVITSPLGVFSIDSCFGSLLLYHLSSYTGNVLSLESTGNVFI